jgi:hypothetical protein
LTFTNLGYKVQIAVVKNRERSNPQDIPWDIPKTGKGPKNYKILKIPTINYNFLK